jgi:hypothetical protein
MSYTTMPTFEGNSLGVRRLVTLGHAGQLLSGLGDTQGDLDAAVAVGIISQNDADTLSALGVTDAQAIALLNQQTDFSSLMYLLATKSATASLPQPQPVSLFTGLSVPPAPAVAPAPGTINYSIPANTGPAAPTPQQSFIGSLLIYQASWTAGAAGLVANVALAITTARTNGIGAIAGLQSALPTTQGKVVSGNVLSNGPANFTISVTVQDNSGHALISDLKSVLDSVLSQVIGTMTVTSTLNMLSQGTGQTGPGAGPGSPQTLTQWFEANWGWLAAAVGAIVIVPQVIKKL